MQTNPAEIINQRGNAVMLHTSTDRADLFIWQEQMAVKYPGFTFHIDTWEFTGPLYAMTIVLTAKQPSAPTAVVEALGRTLNALGRIESLADEMRNSRRPEVLLEIITDYATNWSDERNLLDAARGEEARS